MNSQISKKQMQELLIHLRKINITLAAINNNIAQNVSGIPIKIPVGKDGMPLS